MTSKGYALARAALIRTLTAYSGITTEDGAFDGTATLIDSNLIGRNDFISEKTILIMSGDAKDEDKGATAFDTSDGKITLQGTGFSAQIKAGTIFRILNISSIEIDVANIHEDLGDMADAATSDDMSDILTTSALAKLRLILNRLSPDAFTATIQGAARTALDTMIAQLTLYFAVGGAAIAATVDPGGSERNNLEQILEDIGGMLAGAGITTFPAAADIANGVSMAEAIRAILTSIVGGDDYDAWTKVNNTTVASLNAVAQALAAVLGADNTNVFNPDIAGTARTTLDAALQALDEHMEAIQGGTETLESLDDELDAILDLAEVESIASPVTLTGSVQYIYTHSPGTVFFFAGGFVNRATGTWTNSESVTINVEVKIDGSNWVEVWTKTYAAEPTPATAAIPAEDPDDVLKNFPHGFYNNGDGVRVGIVQTVEGDGYHTWNHSFIDAVKGS